MSNLGGKDFSEDTDKNNSQVGTVDAVVAGSRVTVDNSDPRNPVVSSDDPTTLIDTSVYVAAYLSSTYEGGQTLITFISASAFTLPVGLTGSTFYVGLVSTAEAVFDIQKNGVSVGSLTYAIGVNIPTVTFTTATAFASGDRLSVLAPITPDDTVGNMSLTFKGVV